MALSSSYTYKICWCVYVHYDSKKHVYRNSCFFKLQMRKDSAELFLFTNNQLNAVGHEQSTLLSPDHFSVEEAKYFSYLLFPGYSLLTCLLACSSKRWRQTLFNFGFRICIADWWDYLKPWCHIWKDKQVQCRYLVCNALFWKCNKNFKKFPSSI